MADISLHFSSKAPLAGTYTAFAGSSRPGGSAPASARNSPSSTIAPCAISA